MILAPTVDLSFFDNPQLYATNPAPPPAFAPSPRDRDVVSITLDERSIESYRLFLQIKQLPTYRIIGHQATFPREYADRLGIKTSTPRASTFSPLAGLFDYQRDIASMAIEKQKFAVFADCGLGKTMILLEFARHCAQTLPAGRSVLIVSPLMVVKQTLDELRRFYGETLAIELVTAKQLPTWLADGSRSRIGITNYEALTESTPQGRLGALILDESSMLKSMYGKWGQTCLRLGKGLDWKLCATGTPAPNDRIEYANHAVFLDAFPTVNSFLAKFFINRGQTDNRWEMKPHALEPFYRALSHWCIFLTNPATYGWKDNCSTLPPMHVHVHDDIELTQEQRDLVYWQSGSLFPDKIGGITSRSVLSQIGKGSFRGQDVATNKPAYIRRLIDGWSRDESTILWCWYNREQEVLQRLFPDAANIDGKTPLAKREDLIADFKAGRKRILISKPKILGFGLNLQIATRQVFSGLIDSYEAYYQCVKRSNRYGSTRPLSVHIPVTEIELPMIETVLKKARRVQADTEAQERIFRKVSK